MFGSQPTGYECSKSEIELFSVPDVQTSIEDNYYTRVNPVTAVTSDTAPIEFAINTSTDHFIDPTNIFLYVRFVIKKADGADLPDGYKCYPETNALHTLFNDIEVYINESKVTSGASNYAYRSYLENLLSFTSNEKKSKLITEGFYPETDRSVIANQYSVYKDKVFEGYGRLHIDISHQPRLILSGCNVKLKLFRNGVESVVKKELVDDIRLNVQIEEIYLNVRRVKLSSHEQLYIENTLSKIAAKYPITKVEVKSFTIVNGINSLMLNNVVSGKLPNRIVYGLTEHANFIGSYNKPNFVFNHHNVKTTAVYINGSLFTQPINCSFSDSPLEPSKHIRAYYSLFHELSDASDLVDIGYDEYKDSCCLYSVDITQDRCTDLTRHLNPIKNGNMTLQFEFSQTLTNPLTVVVYLEYSGLIQLDKARQVYTDF